MNTKIFSSLYKEVSIKGSRQKCKRFQNVIKIYLKRERLTFDKIVDILCNDSSFEKNKNST